VFSFDISQLLVIASDLFSSLIPIAAIVGGLALGIGLVSFVLKEVRGIVS
jgi:hypothetical protein